MNSKKLVNLNGYYLPPVSNFPECRDQFTFRYDYIDAILFGGLTSNKNINVWKLDLGKILYK